MRQPTDSTGDRHAPLPRGIVFFPEPGHCGGRLDPDQTVIPHWLAEQIDWHAWPPKSGNAIESGARTVCEHIGWEHVWSQRPDQFAGPAVTGAPHPTALWHAQHELAEYGHHLCLDVELHGTADELVITITGAGFVGRTANSAWPSAAALLTTCTSLIREPRDDGHTTLEMRPARPPSARGQRRLPPGVTPAGWHVGDWLHTWWTYQPGPPRQHCRCPAHPHPQPFGPGTTTSPTRHTPG
jgi:predicted Rdx family selenoprotein